MAIQTQTLMVIQMSEPSIEELNNKFMKALGKFAEKKGRIDSLCEGVPAMLFPIDQLFVQAMALTISGLIDLVENGHEIVIQEKANERNRESC